MKLRVLLAAKRFGVDSYGMHEGATLYRTWYDTADGPAAWNVSACYPDRFEAHTWWFPIVGEVPYSGYFHEPDAQAAADELMVQGFDVLKRDVAAYSTLGWFDDPVFRSALSGDAFSTARLVLHEMAHAVVFFPGRVKWNENFATLVGDRGVVAFFADRYGAHAAATVDARSRLAAASAIGAVIDGVVAELEVLYDSARTSSEKIRLREDVFTRGKAKLASYAGSRMAKRWIGRPWNNALFMSWRRYRGSQDELVAILDGRFAGDVAAFLMWLRSLDAPP